MHPFFVTLENYSTGQKVIDVCLIYKFSENHLKEGGSFLTALREN